MRDRKLIHLNRQRASDAVYGILRDRVLNHGFKPGDKLSVKDLAAKFGVSLTPVKEALARLAGEGLIEIRPQRGTFVTDVVPERVTELYDVRIALELLAAEHAVRHVTAVEIGAMKRVLAELRSCANNPDARVQYISKDMELHTRMVEMSRNRTLISMYETICGRIKVARLLYIGDRWKSKEVARTTEEEHEAMVDALERRDGERLIGILRSHFLWHEQFRKATEAPAGPQSMEK